MTGHQIRGAFARYVDEFDGRAGVRELNTGEQMDVLASRMAGKRLSYKELVA